MSTSRRFVVLIPVKPPAIGKSRLGGLPDERRAELAEAFALDTVRAALAAASVGRVMVVTDDHRFAAKARTLGCAVLPDGVTGDLNASLVQAAHEADRRWPGSPVAALCADLPALRPVELDQAFDQMAADRTAYVADVGGSGTSLYAAPCSADFQPAFGPGSAVAHRTAGAAEIDGDLPSLRTDVDEPVDLGRVLLLGVGPHTAALTGAG